MDLLAILVRPFVMLLLLTMGWVIARLLHRFIPEGRIKRWLYKPRGIYRS